MFYQEKNYQAPRRCRACREKRKSGQVPTMGGKRGGGGGGGDGQPGGGFGGETREQFKVVCSGCGVETTVPFKPNPNRPVYCRTCYQSRRKGGGGRVDAARWNHSFSASRPIMRA
jgi:CxxC-x17-CxxC domain-containing protein